VVPSFNSSGSLDDTRVIRESHPILILKNKTTGEFRFGERDGDNGECVRSLPLNTKAQKNTKWNSLRLDSYDILGVVQINLAFSQEWDKIHEDQLLGQFEIGKLADFREKTIVRRYTRSGRCVITFPTPKRKQGDKAAYPYYENVNQEIVMLASEVSDKIFGTQVNKSLLDEKKIHPELKKLIDYLSNVFSDRLYKKNVPEAERKKKSRSSDDATSVASDDTESVFDDDAASLSSSMSVRSHSRRASSSPAVAGGGGGGAVTVKQPKKTAISSTVSLSQQEEPQQEEPQQNEDAAPAPAPAPPPPPGARG
jgi:pyruvate/2-oxoglutarate dehydrogenase complex dihydrolipoamide acyltransferase (E2) component